VSREISSTLRRKTASCAEEVRLRLWSKGGGELRLAAEGVELGKGHPEGEAVPAQDPRVVARLVDAVRVRRR
jgi:hypothetical protein